MNLERNEVRLILPFQEGIEIIAAQAIELYGKVYALPAAPTDAMKQAVLEATHNAIRHSESPEKKVYISIQHTPEFIKVIIHDKGKGFDPNQIEEINQIEIPGERRSGFGMKIIRSLVDDIKIHSSSKGTHIILVKKTER